MLGGELNQQGEYTVDVGGGAAAAAVAPGGPLQAWASGMPADAANNAFLPAAGGSATGGADEPGGAGEGEEDEEDNDDDDDDEDEDSSDSSEDEEEEEEEEGALNENDWMQVESGATYERSIAGWDVYRYALDGVQTAFFY